MGRVDWAKGLLTQWLLNHWLRNDTTVQNLLAEALNDLFAKYGKPEIAPTAEQES